MQQPRSMNAQVTHQYRLNYLLYLPPGYETTGTEHWPLLVFLHGFGERGDDLERVKLLGPPKLLDNRTDFPFVTISPQCPGDSWWTLEQESLRALLDHALAEYRVDPARVYLTGLSMGGFGTWQMALAYPHYFAAVAPICGGGTPAVADRMKQVPTWVFHGAKDEIVPVVLSEMMVNALKAAGGDVRLTVYPDADHDSWTATYNNPELYEWLLAQRRSG